MNQKQLSFILMIVILNNINASENPDFPARLYRKIGHATGFSASFLATCVANHTFIHNIGHGLTLNNLVKNKKKVTLIDLIDGNVSYPKQSLSKKEEIIYYLAGPVLELGFNYAYYKLMKKVADRHPVFNGFKCGAILGMAEAIVSLIPFKLYLVTTKHSIKSDGYYVLKNLDSEK